MYNLNQLKYLFVVIVLFITIFIYSFYISSSSTMIVALDDWFPVGFEANASSNVAQFNQSTNTSGPRIFCIILSSEKNFLTRAESVYKTWAPRCDMFKFVLKVPSDLAGVKTKPGLDEILQPDGLVEDRYEKLTDKMLLTFKHLYNSPEYNNYDWYLKADDDTFIFVDNLRAFLADKNSSQPVTYGYDFKMFVEGGYHSGGGSYLLSNEALTRIGRQVSQNFSFCNNTGIEDIDVALCLRRLQVYPNKSIDELNRERFHPLSIQHHYREYFPEWLYAYASNPVKSGIECCSDSTISFHYVPPEQMYRINKFLYLNERSSWKFKDLVDYLNL